MALVSIWRGPEGGDEGRIEQGVIRIDNRSMENCPTVSRKICIPQINRLFLRLIVLSTKFRFLCKDNDIEAISAIEDKDIVISAILI